MKKRGEYDDMYDSDEDEVGVVVDTQSSRSDRRTLKTKKKSRRKRRLRRKQRRRMRRPIDPRDRLRAMRRIAEPSRPGVSDRSRSIKRRLPRQVRVQLTLLNEPLPHHPGARLARTHLRPAVVSRPRMAQYGADHPALLSAAAAPSRREVAVRGRHISNRSGKARRRVRLRAPDPRTARPTRSASNRPPHPRPVSPDPARPRPAVPRTSLPSRARLAPPRQGRTARSAKPRLWPTKQRVLRAQTTQGRRRSRMAVVRRITPPLPRLRRI